MFAKDVTSRVARVKGSHHTEILAQAAHAMYDDSTTCFGLSHSCFAVLSNLSVLLVRFPPLMPNLFQLSLQ